MKRTVEIEVPDGIACKGCKFKVSDLDNDEGICSIYKNVLEEKMVNGWYESIKCDQCLNGGK